jgi:hypothetical protein
MAEKVTGKGIWDLFKANIGTVIIIGGLITNGILINNKKVVADYKNSENKVQTEIKIDTLSAKMDRILVNQSEFKKELTNNKEAIEANTKETKATTKAFSLHLTIDKRVEELYQFMQEQKNDEKKNYNYDSMLYQNINHP